MNDEKPWKILLILTPKGVDDFSVYSPTFEGQAQANKVCDKIIPLVGQMHRILKENGPQN